MVIVGADDKPFDEEALRFDEEALRGRFHAVRRRARPHAALAVGQTDVDRLFAPPAADPLGNPRLAKGFGP